MSSSREEGNKNLIRRYVETWNRGDIEGLSRFWARDMIHHTRTKQQGFDEVKQIVADFANAFPDLRFQLSDIVAEGDRVATRMIAHATHLGAYMGVPPTGKKISCAVMGVARVVGDQIAEHWGVTDELAIMAQIGLLPEEYLAAMT
jgi:C-1 hydroxylase